MTPVFTVSLHQFPAGENVQIASMELIDNPAQ